MKEQTKTTAAERGTSTTSTTANGAITFSDEPNAVTIRITGKAFANLKEIAAILNKWDEADNTPADIAHQFMCGDEWLYLDEKKPEALALPQTLAGGIVCAYDECEDMPQLRKAFEAAGFSTQY